MTCVLSGEMPFPKEDALTRYLVLWLERNGSKLLSSFTCKVMDESLFWGVPPLSSRVVTRTMFLPWNVWISRIYILPMKNSATSFDQWFWRDTDGGKSQFYPSMKAPQCKWPGIKKIPEGPQKLKFWHMKVKDSLYPGVLLVLTPLVLSKKLTVYFALVKESLTELFKIYCYRS